MNIWMKEIRSRSTVWEFCLSTCLFVSRNTECEFIRNVRDVLEDFGWNVVI